MIQIGKPNQLKVLRETERGLYLETQPGEEVLLPARSVPGEVRPGDTLEVFLSFDSEDRLVASMEMPYAFVGEYAVLEVISVDSIGAFLDWGLPKDLFLPFAEQTSRLEPGDDVIVFLYLDNTGRISSSMKLDKFLQKTPPSFQAGQEVDLLITGSTELGYKAIIEDQYSGLLYKNEVFQTLRYGQRTRGFVKQVRSDGKIDLSLQRLGYGAAGDIAPKILELLEEKGGFLPIDDRTPPEMIYKLFGVSKKKYKMALSGLYKNRMIAIEKDGIRLLETPKKI